MKVRNRILLLSSLLLLVSVGGIGNIVWQLPHVEQMQDLKAVLHCLILLGLFGVGLIFSVLELVRQELMSPIFQLAAQIARLKERKIDGHRLELTGSKDIDLLTRTLNDLLDGFEKEGNLHHIFVEASPDMIFLLDRDGRVLFGNLNAARQWNYQAEEIIGKRQEELFPPDIATRHKQAVKKIFETGQSIFIDVHETIGQHKCWIDARMVPVLNKDDRVTAVLGISRDITERKNAEEALRESEEKFKSLFESTSDLIQIISPDGRILYVNPAWRSTLGYSDKEATSLSIFDIIHPDSKPHCTEMFRRLMCEGKAENITATFVTKDSKQIIVNGNCACKFVDGKPVLCMGIFCDITERKKAEKEILDLSKFPSENPSPVLRIAKDGEILYSNKPGLELLAHWNVKIGEKAPEKWRRLIKEAFESAKPGLQEEEEEEEEVKSKIFSIVISPVVEAGYVNLYVRDISKHKRAEEAVRTSEAQLSNALKMAHAGHWEYDVVSDTFMFNDNFYRIFRTTAEKVGGYKMSSADYARRFCHPDDMSIVGKEVQAAIEATDPDFSRQIEHRILYADGEVGHIAVRFFIVKDRQGRTVKTFGVNQDITELKRLQEEAAKTKEATILEAMIDGVAVVEMNGNLVQCNSSFAKMFGFKSPEEMKGINLSGLIAERDVQRVMNEVKVRCFESGTAVNFEHAAKDKTGKEFPVLVNASVLKDEKGKIIGTIGVARDITKRKQAEEALRKSEAKYKTLFTSTAEGILVADLETKQLQIRYANPAACRMFGYTEEELMRLGVADMHPKESLDHVLAEFNAQARGEKTLVQLPCLRKDGSVFYTNITGVPMVIEDYKCNVGFFSDVTERKRAEERVAMLSNAIENAHHGCLIISEDYKVLFGNNYALTKLGFDPDELKNLDLFSLCSDREQIKDIIETMKVTKRWMGEIAVIKKDGKQFPALVSITALGTDGDTSGRDGNVILFQDITIQKEMREKLLTSEKLAVMGRLTADVAHELNNPLAIVIGGTQLTLSRLGEKQTSFKNQLETVLRNARRCKTILGNLLGYGRTIGKKEEAVNLPNLIREAIDDVNYQHDMSAIETVLNYGEITNAEITGNRSALLSVFVNLIRNARQAMGEKGCLTVTIEKEDAKHLRIEIHDTGSGISKDQKTKLFKPFTSGWKKDEGSGLGLATSLGIIETHGGSMSAESEGVGKGATFTIILPCEFKRKKG